MVIRLTRATRFFCVCAMLAVTALISIGTKSISVSAPYGVRGRGAFPGASLPLVIYRDIGGDSPLALRLQELRDDLDFLTGSGYTALSERDLMAALRRETPLPGEPVLLLFDDGGEFADKLKPLLEEQGIPWFSLGQSTLLSQELRAAGYPVTRLERTAGFTLEEQLGIRK